MEISQKIVDYAIWYYLKYFPSKKALEKKLFEKFGPNSEKGKIYGGIGEKEIDFILNQKMSSIIFEEEVAKSKIRNYIEKNKNFSYIKTKMFQKYFDKELVLRILREEYNFENETLLNEEKLKKQIILLKQKGKSKNYIKNKFLERSQDKDLVENILSEVFCDGELENLKKEYEKIKNKGFDKQKIFQKLFSKGFNYEDIKRVIS
ncbi:hypothetical protein D8B46_01385 [Candidatus Gracilibacteria bacterium]|nr:MAG: hypothetical protein D8B46_01385 [Candidatus Gracilibacteria bacterium]